ADPRRYPSTDILITSPECTTFSPAGGSRKSKPSRQTVFPEFGDDSIRRSRATMWDVPRFSEYHDYNIIIVENVVEATRWQLFPEWLGVMERLGYCHRIVSINSMFCHPTPQSRDRIYVIFWKAGNHEPLVDLSPPAPCPKCERVVDAVQAWKNGRTVGKYRTQYVYRCPTCTTEVTPYYYAAINALDFSLPAERIRDRKRPLRDRTMARIRWGLERYGRTPLVIRTNMTSGVGCRVRAATISPMDAQPATSITALVSPFVVETLFSQNDDTRAYSVDDPIGAQGSRQARGLAIPPMMQITLAGGKYYRCRDLGAPTATTMAIVNQALVVPPIVQVPLQNRPAPSPVDGALNGVRAQGNHHALVSPAFLADFYNLGKQCTQLSDASKSMSTRVHQGLVVPPAFLTNYYGGDDHTRRVTPLDGAQCTVSVSNRSALTVPETIEAEDCYFRMLQPQEIGAAMAFPTTYTVLGTKRDRVKQYGNAVTPPAMEFLIQRCVESLAA
ncbi:hypothetical protein LCGC14_2400010, partial [marine sediment metagenome]